MPDNNQIPQSLCLTKENIQRVAQKIPSRYAYDHKVLEDCIKQMPQNSDLLAQIYFKISLINSVYSTRMGPEYCFSMAKLLTEHNNLLEEIIETSNTSKFDDLIKICQAKKDDDDIEAVHYSFLTKYISTHQRYSNKLSKPNDNNFPIYDGYVGRMLKMYNKNGWYINNLKASDLKNYTNFYEYMSLLKGKELTFRDLDTFLWYYGKMLEEAGTKILKEKFTGKHSYFYKCRIDSIASFAEKIEIDENEAFKILIKEADQKINSSTYNSLEAKS